MIYHIVSNDKYLIDVISLPHLGAPGMLGCRPIVRSYEFEWDIVLRTEWNLKTAQCLKM